ncbi:MAG: hypothetical protein DWI22_06895 [Planctomycetota bacterium]|nr:MAG: hypothetical protein DWI22_06895 [Planctomycetota bacterium]
MKTRYSRIFVATLFASLFVDLMSPAFGRGGRGGGGGFNAGALRGGGGGGGGGGVSRPSGGFSGAAVTRPSGTMSRPSVGSSPSFNRPSSAISRPNSGTGSGTRPSIQPGTRPNIGTGSGLSSATRDGSRPATLPTTRPSTGIGSGVGIRSRPATLPSTRPVRTGGGERLANRVGNTLPGLGNGNAGSRLPNQGEGLQERAANRPQTVEDRRSSLDERMTSGGEDRPDRGELQDDRQEWRDDNREDWQDHLSEHHGDWHNGSWDLGDGWDYMWDNHPVAAAVGVTRWSVNRLAYGFGYWGYVNPYYGPAYSTSSYSYSYAQPLVVYSTAAPTDPGVQTAAAAPVEPPQPTDEGMAAFEAARTAFYGGEYEKSLTLMDTTLKTMPHDTVVHQFRGLVLFALKKYPEAAAAIYAVLSAGPGWDWTTMSGVYPGVDVYTKQLRDLENFVKSNPASADGTFLLGYHYMTMGHKDVANQYFGMALKQLPGDKLLTQLAGTTTPVSASSKSSSPTPPPAAELPADQILSADKMVGTWKASNPDAQFELTLAKDGTFVWSYSRGKTKEAVKGVFAIHQNNLAMEPDAGGTMVAEITSSGPTQFHFQMVGGEPDDKGLIFDKNP